MPNQKKVDTVRALDDRMITFETKILPGNFSLIAVDLGYSRERTTCGLMHDGIDEPIVLTFGDAIIHVKEFIKRERFCILVIEAVLSTFHNSKGNPDIRGEFEKGRGWYYGPGVVTLAAALRFLKVLRKEVSKDERIIISEAFLSFKKDRSNHSNDAKIIYEQFWKTQPEKIREGTEPILEFISGVPSVRVFNE